MKKQLLVTALGIGLLIVCVYFLIGIISLNSEQEALRIKISDANEMIALIPEVPSDLEQRLANIEASLVSEQSKLTELVNTTQVINTLLDMASANRIDVVFISTTPWMLVNIENYNYLIFTISLDIEGELNALTAFLRTLEDGLPESVSIQHIAVAGDTEQVIESSWVTASMEVVIYAQAPATDDTELFQEEDDS